MVALFVGDVVSLIAETRFNSVSAIVVIERLERSAPEDLTADEKKAFKAMIAAKRGVETVRQERAQRPPSKVRSANAASAAVWGGLSDVLAAKAALPVIAAGDKAERAAKLRRVLFPEGGVPQLRVDAATAYVEANERIERVTSADLMDELAELVGVEHVVAIRKTTEALGEALGVGESVRPAPTGTEMQAALREATYAVSRYGRRLFAALDEDDESSVKRFMDALAPLAEHKASQARSPSTDDDDEDAPTDATPAPVAPTNGTPTPVAS